jgi:hypothetical protein
MRVSFLFLSHHRHRPRRGALGYKLAPSETV